MKAPLHWPSLIQLILSLLAAIILLGGAVTISITAATDYYSHAAGSTDLVQPFMVAASLAFAGALMLPSAWYAWKQITHPEHELNPYPDQRRFSLILTIVVIILVGGTLFLGNRIVQDNRVSWLLLPPLNIIANGLPVLWIAYIGSHGLIAGNPRRLWGVFGSGLVLGPLIILILELILLAFMAVLAFFWASLDPSLSGQLNGLLRSIQNTGPNPDAIIRLVMPFLLNPGIIFLIFAFVAVLVPMLEEAIKPLGVWFLAGQKITPIQGFGYGVLSGAGFGLFENLGNTSGAAADWAILAATRISTLMLHCFTAGLLGWALASAWSERRYIRLAITYAIAVTIHGVWNGLVLISTASSLQGFTNISLPGYLQQLGMLASLGIIILGVLVLVLFLSFSTIFRHRTTAHMISQAQGARVQQALEYVNESSKTEPTGRIPETGLSDKPATLPDASQSNHEADPESLPDKENPPDIKGNHE